MVAPEYNCIFIQPCEEIWQAGFCISSSASNRPIPSALKMLVVVPRVGCGGMSSLVGERSGWRLRHCMAFNVVSISHVIDGKRIMNPTASAKVQEHEVSLVPVRYPDGQGTITAAPSSLPARRSASARFASSSP